MKIDKMLMAGALVLVCVCTVGWPVLANDSQVPVRDTVTMVDLGATSCVPCKLMEPVLASLKKQYQGRAAVVFIDVTRDHGAAREFGIRVIPTQIFFDATGKEVWRHVGFLDEKSCREQLNRLLSRKE